MLTAYEVLLRELIAHGAVTYKQLVHRYGDRGYTYNQFTAAAHKLRQDGLALPVHLSHRHVVKAPGAQCPCCGRAL
jgi:hypothetical protein